MPSAECPNVKKRVLQQEAYPALWCNVDVQSHYFHLAYGDQRRILVPLDLIIRKYGAYKYVTILSDWLIETKQKDKNTCQR